MLTDIAWWKAAGLRVARTVLMVLLTFLPAFGTDGTTAAELQRFGLVAGLAAVLSLATSWANLPELADGARRWWVAVADRFLRTFGQVLVASAGGALLLTDVDWLDTVQRAGWAALGTVVLAFVAKLPESEPAPQPADVPGRHELVD